MNAHVMVHFKSFSDFQQNNAAQKYVESEIKSVSSLKSKVRNRPE